MIIIVKFCLILNTHTQNKESTHKICLQTFCKMIFFSFIVTGASDCLLLLVCFLTIAIQQVFARPINGQDYHLKMSLEPNIQSLEDALRSPCREANLPREDQSAASIKGVLQIIGRQSAIAKSIAKEDIEKYVSKSFLIEQLEYINWLLYDERTVRQYGDSIQK